MFKLSTKTSYKRKINIRIPLDLGKVDKASFVVEFRLLPVSEIKDTLEQAKNQDLTDEDILQQNILGWSGVCDDSGEEMPFTDDNLELILDISYVRKPLMDALMEDMLGKEVLRKNS
jgi:hypothetical protein